MVGAVIYYGGKMCVCGGDASWLSSNGISQEEAGAGSVHLRAEGM